MSYSYEPMSNTTVAAANTFVCVLCNVRILDSREERTDSI